MEGALPEVDPNEPVSPLKKRLVGAAVSKPGTWFYKNVAARIDPHLMRASGGRVELGFGLMPVLVMTVKGRKSGAERTTQLLYFTDGGDPILMASSFGRADQHPAWYLNARAADRVRLEARGRSGWYRAEETEGAERDRLYTLAQKIYWGYGVYEERAGGRKIPVLRMKLDE